MVEDAAQARDTARLEDIKREVGRRVPLPQDGVQIMWHDQETAVDEASIERVIVTDPGVEPGLTVAEEGVERDVAQPLIEICNRTHRVSVAGSRRVVEHIDQPDQIAEIIGSGIRVFEIGVTVSCRIVALPAQVSLFTDRRTTATFAEAAIDVSVWIVGEPPPSKLAVERFDENVRSVLLGSRAG